MAEPQSLLHFKIIETLGTGGNGTVYRAQDTRSNHVVALKTLKNVSDTALARFKREFHALKKMDDPGIIKVYEGFFDHHPPFFTMEWVKGKTLSNMIVDLENNPMVFSVSDRENFALRLALQVCDILSYIHGFEEVHRDLKPDNIFITMAGNDLLSDFSVKMLDFGLLKGVNDAGKDEDTDGGMIVGTVHYLSPEQAKGTAIDLRSDLFSLGIILYKIISLKLPYEAQDVVGYIFKTVFEEPEPIETHTPKVDAKLAALLRDLLARDPGKRPPSAQALKRRIKNLLDQEPLMDQMDIEAADLDFAAGLEGFGSPLLPAPLTGRDIELQRMEKMLRHSMSGRPLAVILEGEPGMGRTTMIKEWRGRIKPHHPVIMQAHFSEEVIVTQDPIGLLVDSLVRVLKPEEVRKLFKDVYPFLISVSRYLGRYFDAKSVGKFDHLSPSRKLQVLAVNFIKLLGALTSQGPVVLILEDVHNAPERFFGWLTLLWEQLGGQQLLLVLSCTQDTTRGAFTQFCHRLAEQPDNAVLPLEPLDKKQTVHLLQSMLPIGVELPFSDKLVKLLMERANGNPFYAIELFSVLYEEGQLFVERGSLDVKNTGSLDVPLSIHQALLKKVQRLPAETQLMLKAATVLGHTFDYQYLVACLRWTDEQFFHHLDVLVKLGILTEEERPTHRIHFNAPALQKILYDQIPPKEREFLHNNTAKSVESLMAADDVVGLEQIAQHYAKGANHVRAVKFAYLAGNSALEAKETDRAVYFYELSLAMMDKMENKQAGNLVMLKLAEVHLANEQPDKALAYYDASLTSQNLSRMEKLRTLRGRMLCHEKLNHLSMALADAEALCQMATACSNRIQAETRLARGFLDWQTNGNAQNYLRDVLKANLLYNKLPNWPVRTAFAQILANDTLEANKRLTELAKLDFSPRFPVYLLLAFLRYFMGDFAKAKAFLGKAREGEDGGILDPAWMVAHALLTFKVQATMAPDHPVDEYLSIANRYIERFGLQNLRIKLTLAQLEHYLMTGQYEQAWKITAALVKESPDLPLEYMDYHLFLTLTVRSAWEVQERPPRGWLHKFQRFTPTEDTTFLLQVHYALAKAAEASLPLSMAGAEAMRALKSVQKLLIKTKLKYYYRATLIKEIGLLRNMGQLDQVAKLDELRQQIDSTIDVKLPTG